MTKEVVIFACFLFLHKNQSTCFKFLVPVTEAWRDELKALTDAIKDYQPPQEQQQKPLERPKTQYSETTGRLIPPPSRAMSRGNSRQASRQGSRGGNRNFQHIAEDPDMETEVSSHFF